MSDPFLSLVIPAYNEERRLPKTLEQVSRFLAAQSYSAEVLVVENGSQDRTLEIAQAFAAQNPLVRVFQNERRGKGLAVQRGMLEARGAYRFMCDSDFSMPIEEVNRFLPPLLEGFPVAIASREAPGAVRYHEPPYRHFVGRVYNWMIRLVALPGLQDTQCGFKCFRADAAQSLFALQSMPGWSFDVEVLFIAQRKGYRIAEIPIPWYFNPDTKVRVLHDSFNMAVDLLRIRLNYLRGMYGRA